MGGRAKIQVDRLSAGTWALIEGIDQNVAKTGTVLDFEQSMNSL